MFQDRVPWQALVLAVLNFRVMLHGFSSLVLVSRCILALHNRFI
jgi:hypothetical protein